MRRSRRLSTAAALVLLVASGCTTVDRTGLAVGGGAGPAGAGAATGPGQGPTGTVAGSTAGPSGAAGPATGVQAAGAAGAAASGRSGSTASGGGAPVVSSPSAATGPGGAPTPGRTSCSHPVKIGISYSSDESAGLSAVGNPSAALQNSNAVQQEQADFQLIANNINATGGLAGCQVQLVYHDFKSLGSDGFSGESQTECTDFAQDQKVFAAIPTVLENKTIITCLGQAHVVDFYSSAGGTYQPNPQDFKTYQGYLYQPDAVSSYRFGPFIQDLAAAGYFGPGAKVGILLADDGTGNNQYLVNNLWKPQLAALHITPTVFTFHAIEGYSDVTDTASSFQSAVLQFKAAGVNRVMFTPDGGDGTIFFTQTASSQNYSPQYALTSDSGAVAWPTEPASQRPNALDVSFGVLDLGESATPQQIAGAGASSSRNRCTSILNGHTGSVSLATYYGACDIFFLMQAALKGAPAVTAAALQAGVDRLGSSFSIGGGYAHASFGPPDHYDGASAVRVLKWNESIQQWQYQSGPLATPWAG